MDEANTYALDDAAAANAADSDDTIVATDNVDPEVGETNDLELGGEDEPASDDDGAVTTYWFLVNNELYSEQTVGEGEALVRPGDPAAPEGMAFAGWYTENGAQLFADETGMAVDGVPFVNVFAMFVEAETEDGAEIPVDADIEEQQEAPEITPDAENVPDMEGEDVSDVEEEPAPKAEGELVTDDES